MGLDCWLEGLRNTYVKLLCANAKPAAAPPTQRFGLFDFLQAQQTAEESTGLRLTSPRSGKLDKYR